MSAVGPKESWSSAPAVEEPRKRRDDPGLSALKKQIAFFCKLSACVGERPAGNGILVGDASF
jgi:hypothetical protein